MYFRILILLFSFVFLTACGGGIQPITYPTVSLSTSHTSATENSDTIVTLTVTASKISDEDITVVLSTSGTATDGTDYSTVNGLSLTITAGLTTATETFTITDDSTYEGNETATIAISTVSGGSAIENGTQSVSITITENEFTPTVTLITSHTSVAENSGTTVTLTATSSQVADEDITVTLASSGVATNGTDYSPLGSQTITISAGATTGAIISTPIDDSIYEGDEVATITISNVSGGGAAESGTQSVSITITENESAPTVSITTSASSVYDNGSNLTLTATSTQISDEDVVVVISTLGSATEGEDYSNVSDITIAAGLTTGTTTFNPTSDTVNEGSETATLYISSVLGADSSIGESNSVIITINEYALRTGTTFTEGTAAKQIEIKSETQWRNVNNDSSLHPYEQMNIHKVQSFSDGTDNLTGKGQLIHIADFNCETDHEIYNNKTVYVLGGFYNDDASNYHCQFVASIAAGDGTGDGDAPGDNYMSGVAPDADLVLSSIGFFWGYSGDDYADDLNSARNYGAIVSNNSWAIGDDTDGNPNAVWNITEIKDYILNNGLTNDQGLALLLEGSSSSGAITATQEYITALENFQNSGVVVFASGNYTGESDVSAVAALPELFPQLSEAWISVGLINFSGSSISSATESDFTLHGNICGSAKEYCVVADGYEVNGASYVLPGGAGGGGSQYTSGSGSSYSAPMVSGGIALLAQAFPNHTPEQLTDRLLASANNSWFTPEGNTTFTTHGNSITHGYHSTWGQGLPDFYAALSPITSNANPAVALYMGSSIQEGSSNGSSVALASSSITPSASFGDSIYQGLSGEVGYAYDALSGGFKYDMTTRIDMSNNDVQTIDLTSELSKLDSPLSLANLSWKDNFSQVLSKLSETDKLKTSLTVGASSLPVQSFFGSNFDSSINLNDYETPYLESGEGGIGLGATYQLGDSRLLVGMTNPINQSNDNVIGLRKSLVASLEYGNPSDSAITFMVGTTQDDDSLLGSTGNDAYSLSGAKSNTVFTAFKAQTQLGRDLSLTGIATLANTNMTRPNDSFINSASNVKSASVSLVANKRGLFGDDNISFFVSQPNRVSDGRLSIRLSNLADSDGSLTYRNKVINLEPTARQLDYGLSYRKDFDNDISFSVKHMMTNNLNHKQDSQTVSSSFIGAKYKDLKVGFAKNPGEESRSAEISYSMQF